MGSIEVDVDSLIELVKICPHLYDVKNKNYKNNITKEKSWEEVSAALSISIDDCKRLWKNLRDRFTKERRSLIMGPDGPTSNWPHYKAMEFYSQYCTPRRSMVPVKKHVDADTSEICTRYRSIAPKQTPQAADMKSQSYCAEDSSGKQSELRHCMRNDYDKKEKPSTGLTLKRRLFNSLDDVESDRQTSVDRTAAASGVNDAFALYLANRLNEMSPEMAREKRKLIISVIEDL